MLRRVVAFVVVVGMAGWAATPVASADPAQAVQLAQAHAAGPIESALADALHAAVQASEADDVFAEALLASLDAHPDGEALARFVRDFEGSQSDLLAILAGHLFRAHHFGSPHLQAIAPAGSGVSLVTGAAPVGTSARTGPADAIRSSASLQAHTPELGVVPVEERSAAQPLGP